MSHVNMLSVSGIFHIPLSTQVAGSSLKNFEFFLFSLIDGMRSSGKSTPQRIHVHQKEVNHKYAIATGFWLTSPFPLTLSSLL